MKKLFKKFIYLIVACITVVSCSSDDSETPNAQEPIPFNNNENKFVGTWQYMETPHSSGVGGPTSFYKSYFTINSDRTAATGFNEFITATQNNSSFDNRTFSATATTYTFTLPNGTQETGNYEFIDLTHIKMYSPGSTTLFRIYTKQNLNANEVKLIGKWQYMVTPHPSGLGGPTSFYKTYFICNADKTSVRVLVNSLHPHNSFLDLNFVRGLQLGQLGHGLYQMAPKKLAIMNLLMLHTLKCIKLEVHHLQFIPSNKLVVK